MIRLQLLGTLALTSDEDADAAQVLAHGKRVALLSYLALAQPRGFHRRDRLYALLWPDADTERARNSLRQAVHQLRRVLGTAAVVNRGDDELGLAPDALACDALELERAVEQGRHAEAVALYGGELLAGFHVTGARDFGDWLDGERERLRDLATQAAWAHAEDLARGGDPGGGVRVARIAAGWRPFNETANRRLIELLDRLGDTAGALRAYDAFAERLRTELESAPSEATAALVRDIRARSPVLPPPPTWAVPETSEPPERPVRRWRPGVFYAAGVLTVLAIAMWQGGRRARAVRADPSRLTVFPFAVRGSAALGYLGDGMVDLLSAKFEGAAGLHAIDPRSVISAVAARGDTAAPDLAAYGRIAGQLGAGRFIVGDLVQVGSGVQLSATLHDVADGRTITSASVTGTAAGLFELVDGLTGRLLAGLTGGRDTTLTRLAALTTHSLPALQAFLEGEQALRAGRDRRAADAFREATTLDTGFALAHYRLALVATWVSLRDVPIPAVRAAAAARHAQRLTPLVRDLLGAFQAYKEVRAEDAERMYLAVTEAHPDNVEAWFMLGETRFHYNTFRGRSAMEAWPAFQRVLALDPTNAHAAIHLARLAAQAGRFDELDSLAAGYLARYQDAERALEMRALVAYARNDSTERATIAAAAREADPLVVLSLLQAAAQYAQNFDAAGDLAPRFAGAMADASTRTVGRRTLSALPLAGGRLNREPVARLLGSAVEEDWLLESAALVAADPLFPAPRLWIAAVRDRVAARRPYRALMPPLARPEPRYGPLAQAYLLGLLSVRLGDSVAVQRHLMDLTRSGGGGEPGASLAAGVRAELARTRGDPSGALRELAAFAVDSIPWSRRPMNWGSRERFLRAEVLHALGRDTEALPWYESMQGEHETVYLAATQLREGEIYERLKAPKLAAFHYTRFIRMWKDCDPELQPLVERARGALARLRPS
jgi:DNA-binding SARP family transcriptional activator/TolB-like protein